MRVFYRDAGIAHLRAIIGNLATLVERMKAESMWAHLLHNDEWHGAIQNAIDSARRVAAGEANWQKSGAVCVTPKGRGQ